MQEQPSSSRSRRTSENILEVQNLTFLTNGPYSFSLREGECLGMCGASGVGKTQLLRALADLIDYSGTVRFRGRASDEYHPTDWRRMVGMVPADPHWWYDTVGEHFNNRGKSATLHCMLERFGFEYDIINWEVARLSTGERQRLAFIRSIILDPPVVLLDEPTSALDYKNTERFEKVVRELRTGKGMSVIWVSHDSPQLSRVTDRILQVDKKGLLPLVLN